MTFGLADAQATFQRAISKVLKPLIGKSVYVYVDDITIYTRTFKEHLEVLREVLHRLRDNKFFLKAKKCMIAADEVELLGHKVNAKGVHTTEKITKAVSDFPRPTNRTEMRSFLGLVGYYRTFIFQFSAVAKPLNDLLRKDIPFRWTDEAQEAFECLKEKLITAPILRRPDVDLPFILTTDASKEGLGAVLSQMQQHDDDEKPREVVVAYASKGTKPSERNYGATQLELLAVVWATEHFQHYLVGRRFTLVTDHTSLKWLMNIDSPTGLFARWITRLQKFDMEIEYKPGKKNQNADALSRMRRKGPRFMITLDEMKNNLSEEETLNALMAGHLGTARSPK